MVEDGAFSHKIDYFTFFLKILNLEGQANHTIGSRLNTILLNGWVWHLGRASAVEGLQSMGRPCLVVYISSYLNRATLSSFVWF